jgi:hypothetical protein
LNADFVRAAIGGAGMVGVLNVGYMLVCFHPEMKDFYVFEI